MRRWNLRDAVLLETFPVGDAQIRCCWGLPGAFKLIMLHVAVSNMTGASQARPVQLYQCWPATRKATFRFGTPSPERLRGRCLPTPPGAYLSFYGTSGQTSPLRHKHSRLCTGVSGSNAAKDPPTYICKIKIITRLGHMCLSKDGVLCISQAHTGEKALTLGFWDVHHD